MMMEDLTTLQISSSSPIYTRTKLRPLMPRPILSNSTTFSFPNFTTWLQTPSCGVKKEVTAPPLVSMRWNPTPEQLKALEDMYQRGMKTPSAEQIQQIAAKLRRFGKIEGKNVFYWFQNHKARERQKKRRREMELLDRKRKRMDLDDDDHQTLEKRQTGVMMHKRYLVEIESKEKSAASMVGSELGHEEFQQTITANNWCQLDLSPPKLGPPVLTKQNKTLDLFPLNSNNEQHTHHFIEFLPITRNY